MGCLPSNIFLFINTIPYLFIMLNIFNSLALVLQFMYVDVGVAGSLLHGEALFRNVQAGGDSSSFPIIISTIS